MTDPIDDLPDDVLAALRAPAPVDPAIRDAHLAAALDLYDSTDLTAGAPVVDAGGQVVALRRRRPGRWLAVAAGLLIAVGGVLALSLRSEPNGVQTAGRADNVERSSTAAGVASGQVATSGAQKSADSPASTVSPELRQAAPASDGTPSAPEPGSAFSNAGATAAPAVGPSQCHAPRLRAAFVSAELRSIGGVERLVDTYAWGPGGQLRISVVLDPQTCART